MNFCKFFKIIFTGHTVAFSFPPFAPELYYLAKVRSIQPGVLWCNQAVSCLETFIYDFHYTLTV